jgi:hypothetical protein
MQFVEQEKLACQLFSVTCLLCFVSRRSLTLGNRISEKNMKRKPEKHEVAFSS